MDVFSPKERLAKTLAKQKVDRPPVICPGGMMNAAIVDVMKKGGHSLPGAHHDASLMSELAFDVYENTGFENLGVPFCMTVEAEALGSQINYGSLECEPKIQKEKFSSVTTVDFQSKGSIEKTSRGEAVLGAIYSLAQKHPDVPVVGSLTGPLSTAASLVDPMTFLKELRKDREGAHKVLAYVAEQLIDFAHLMADNGASVISIADPTATGEILGPKMFGEFAVLYLNKITEAIHEMGLPVIVHICGDVRAVKEELAKLGSDALSLDALVSLKQLKSDIAHLTTMGNLSTYLLEFGNPESVFTKASALLTQNIDILAPACGLSTSTPLENIVSFTQAVKNS
jgi:[methyl-Co(III) methanol-specific corrinoid protein]:coenzyme M methyltransferase